MVGARVMCVCVWGGGRLPQIVIIMGKGGISPQKSILTYTFTKDEKHIMSLFLESVIFSYCLVSYTAIVLPLGDIHYI